MKCPFAESISSEFSFQSVPLSEWETLISFWKFRSATTNLLEVLIVFRDTCTDNSFALNYLIFLLFVVLYYICKDLPVLMAQK